MAPVLMVVAWNISEQNYFYHILKIRTGDSLVLLVTFTLTVFTLLTRTVEIGLILAVILFIKRMINILVISKGLPDYTKNNDKLLPHMVSKSYFTQ